MIRLPKEIADKIKYESTSDCACFGSGTTQYTLTFTMKCELNKNLIEQLPDDDLVIKQMQENIEAKFAQLILEAAEKIEKENQVI